jgi:hypothetical protein
MPRRDGTGPMGAGSMTGRGLGLCTGVNARGYGAGLGLGWGLACRRGFGRGFGRGYAAVPYAINPDYQKSPKELLEAQKDILQNSLDTINKQLEDF